MNNKIDRKKYIFIFLLTAVFMTNAVSGRTSGIAQPKAIGTVGCLSPRLSLQSQLLSEHSMLKFLKINKIKIKPDKLLPAVITLRSIKDNSRFVLRKGKKSTLGTYYLFIDGIMIKDSHFLVRESPSEIGVYNMCINGPDYKLTRKGIGRTFLVYLSLLAMRKGKDLVIKDTSNYGLMHMCWNYLSADSRYYPVGSDAVSGYSFEQLQWILKSERIRVDISDPLRWDGDYILQESGEFIFDGSMVDNEFASQIKVQMPLDRNIRVSWADPEQNQEPLSYIIHTNISLEKIVISFAGMPEKAKENQVNEQSHADANKGLSMPRLIMKGPELLSYIRTAI